MSAADHLNQYQLRYQPLPKEFGPEMRHSIHVIDTKSSSGREGVGHMQWAGNDWNGRIWDLEVDADHQRRGLGTAMYQKAKRLAESSNGLIVPPAHSDTRTPAGDAWAQRVGGDLPDNRLVN